MTPAKGTLARRHARPMKSPPPSVLASDDASYVTGTLLFRRRGYTAMCNGLRSGGVDERRK